MHVKLDTNLIRRLTPARLTSHFNSLLSLHPGAEADVTSQLLQLVEREAIASTVFVVWLYQTKSPKTLLAALDQDFSVHIRTRGINQLTNLLRTKRWRNIWDGIGGTARLLSLLAQFSAAHVEQFMSRMGRGVNGRVDEERGRMIAELLQGLLPLLFPEVVLKTVDERRFTDGSGKSLYAVLLPMCDSHFVNMVANDKTKMSICNPKFIDPILQPPQFKLLPSYWNSLRTSGQRRLLIPLESLILSFPISPRHIPGISQWMQFSLHLLRQLAADPDIEVDAKLLVTTTIILPLVRKAWKCRHRIAKHDMESIFDCSIKYLDAHPEDMRLITIDCYTNKHEFLYYLTRMWEFSSQSKFFTDCLSSILQKTQNESLPGLYVWRGATIIVAWVEPSKRYDLLRLFLLNYREKTFDLDKDEDLTTLLPKFDADQSEKWDLSSILKLVDHKHGLDLVRRTGGTIGEYYLYFIETKL
jgi:hypothetical protein